MNQRATQFLVAFDLDGTILHDSWAHAAANKASAQRLGISTEVFGDMTGFSLRESWEQISKKTGVHIDLDELAEEHFQITYQLICQRGEQPAPGLEQVMRQLKEAGCTVAVTSSSDEWFVRSVVKFLKLDPYIDFYVTNNQVKQLKPEPDIYLEALKAAGVCAKQAVGVEDSLAGCTAVNRAGMVCIGFLNQGHNRQNLSGAAYRIQTMSEIPEIVHSLCSQ